MSKANKIEKSAERKLKARKEEFFAKYRQLCEKYDLSIDADIVGCSYVCEYVPDTHFSEIENDLKS